MSTLNSEKALVGAYWLMLANIASVALKFLTIPILARMLTPEDFGVVAIGMSVVIFLSYIGGKGGFSAALIANKSSTDVGWISALWANIVIGVFLGSIMILFSSELANFLGSPKSDLFIHILAFLIPIQFAVDILNAKVISKLSFKKEALISSSADVIAGIISLIAAFMGMGAWALILQHFLSQVIRMLGFSYVDKFWMKCQFSYFELKKLFGFSIISIGVEIANFMAWHAPIVIASKFVGVQSSGALSVQSRLSALPGDIVLQGITKVLFPMFSSNTLSKKGLQEGLLWSVWVNSILLMPILFGMSVLAENITNLILGSQFKDYFFVLTGLAFTRAVMVPCSSFNPYLKATGEIKLLFYIFALRAILVVSSGIILTLQYGLRGLVFAIAISSVGSLCLYVPITYRVANINLVDGCKAFFPALISAILMFLVIKLFMSLTSFNFAVELILSIFLGALIYLAGLMFFYKEFIHIKNYKQLKLFFSKRPQF